MAGVGCVQCACCYFWLCPSTWMFPLVGNKGWIGRKVAFPLYAFDGSVHAPSASLCGTVPLITPVGLEWPAKNSCSGVCSIAEVFNGSLPT